MIEHTKPTTAILSLALAFCIFASGAAYGGGTTSTEKIDTGNMFYNPSIAVGNNDEPNICYEDSTGNLVFAEKIENGWDKVIIETLADNSFAASLDIDQDGNPHISYTVKDVGLKYAMRKGSDWAISVVDGGYVGASSLAIDPKGFVHISYIDGTNHTLKYARQTGSSWQIEIVEMFDNDTNVIYNEIEIDSDENPHIIYSYQMGWLPDSDMVIRYAQRQIGDWAIETISTQGQSVPTSFCLDSNDHPNVVLWSVQLSYAVKTDEGWQIELVPSTLSYMSSDSLAFNSKNEPILCYFDPENRTVNVATRSGQRWNVSELYHSKLLGQWVSISPVLDSKDNYHILLEDTVNFELFYLYVRGSVDQSFPTMYIFIMVLVACAIFAITALWHHRRRIIVEESRLDTEEKSTREENRDN